MRPYPLLPTLALFALLAAPTAAMAAAPPAGPAPAVTPASSPSIAPAPSPPDSTPWQQRASYRLDAALDPAAHTVAGREVLTYVNNSPQELTELYFHLYHAAARPGSALDRLRRDSDNWEVADLAPSRWGDCAVESLTVNGQPCSLSTALREKSVAWVRLPKPLAPGDSARVEFRFQDRFPELNLHDGYRGRDFSAGEWFPKVCVFDACPLHPQGGWHRDAWSGRGEFYSDFGDYQVALTLPASYLAVSTGQLLNPADVLPADVLLRLRGLGDRPVRVWERAAASDSLRRAVHTWRFRASRVHDFAFAALETWAWDAVRVGGVTVSCTYPPADARVWAGAASHAGELLSDFSRRLGAYPYDHLEVVGTRALGASVEKPQMVWISQLHYRDRGSRRFDEVLAHELAHQWFYGLVANDEAGEAYLDEGLASWLALRAMERRFGPRNNLLAPRSWAERHLATPDDFRSELWRAALDWEKRGLAEPAARASADFSTQQAYVRAAYTRSALMLDALDRALGPDRFEAALRGYAARWCYAHPHLPDFQAAMEAAGGAPLDSFFGFWLRGKVPVAVPPEGLGPVAQESPSRRLALQFENGIPALEARRVDRSTLWWRPAVTFGDASGLGAGVRLRLEPPRATWTATYEFVLPSRRVDGGLRPWGDSGLTGRWWAGSLWGEGRFEYLLGEGRSLARLASRAWYQPEPGRTPRYFLGAALERWSLTRRVYLRDPRAWEPGTQPAGEVSLGWESVGRGVSMREELQLRSGLGGGSADFRRLSGEFCADWKRGGRDRVRLRVAAGTFAHLEARDTVSLGTDINLLPNPAAQELFRLADAGPLAEYQGPLLRSRGLFQAGGHAAVAGGAGVRGYFDRGVTAERFVAVNAELTLARVAAGSEQGAGSALNALRLPAVQALAFGDGARLGRPHSGDWTGLYLDAGLSLAARVGPWDLPVRLDFPLWLNQPADGEHAVAFRWLLSVGSLFRQSQEGSGR